MRVPDSDCRHCVGPVSRPAIGTAARLLVSSRPGNGENHRAGRSCRRQWPSPHADARAFATSRSGGAPWRPGSPQESTSSGGSPGADSPSSSSASRLRRSSPRSAAPCNRRRWQRSRRCGPDRQPAGVAFGKRALVARLLLPAFGVDDAKSPASAVAQRHAGAGLDFDHEHLSATLAPTPRPKRSANIRLALAIAKTLPAGLGTLLFTLRHRLHLVRTVTQATLGWASVASAPG